MTSSSDRSESGMSLDFTFTPVSRQQWVELAVAGVGAGGNDAQALQALQRTTLEGIPVELLYDAAEFSFQSLPDIAQTDYWDNRLRVSDTGAGQANTVILQGLAGGITSIELHPGDITDIAAALEGVRLDLAKVSLRAGEHYQQCAGVLAELASQQGIPLSGFRCDINADPVGNYLLGCSGNDTLPADLSAMAGFAKSSAEQMPAAHSVLVDAAIHHNAGASTVEELHAALATATLYLEAMLEAGMEGSDACRQIVFQIGMDADVLLGVAKIRALKALWQHLLQLLIADVEPLPGTVIVAETSRRFLTTLEPWNNHLRNIAAGTAAILGGADTLMVHPHDALLRQHTDVDTTLGDRMARNIAIILERECGLRKVHDPMAGAYAIENLTQQLMKMTWQSLASTDTSEGWLDELTSGRWQTRLSNTHQLRVTLMKDDKRVAVGVNRFVQTEATAHRADIPAPDPSIRLQPVRESSRFEPATTHGEAS